MSELPPLACPVCGSASLHPWALRNGYRLYSCVECTHIFADVRSFIVLATDPDEFRAKFTNGTMASDLDYYQHLCKGEHQHTGKIVRKVARLAGKASVGARWLDVGAGSGYLLTVIRELGYRAIGIEPGGWGQIAAKERGLEVVQGYLASDTFAEKFDVVSATDVLEHQPDPYFLTRIMLQSLKPGGRIFCSIPYADCLNAKLFRGSWEMVAPPTHCQYFTKQSLRRYAERAGARLEVVGRCNASELPINAKYATINRGLFWLLDALPLGDQLIFTLRLPD